MPHTSQHFKFELKLTENFERCPQIIKSHESFPNAARFEHYWVDRATVTGYIKITGGAIYYKTIIAQLEELPFIKKYKPRIEVEGLIKKQGEELDLTIRSYIHQQIRDRQPVRYVTFEISGSVNDVAPYLSMITFQEDDLLLEGSLIADYTGGRLLGRLRTKRAVVSNVISQHIKDKNLIPSQNETDLILHFQSPVTLKEWKTIGLEMDAATINNERYDMDRRFFDQKSITQNQRESHMQWIHYRVTLLRHDQSVVDCYKEENVLKRQQIKKMIERFSHYMTVDPNMRYA